MYIMNNYFCLRCGKVFNFRTNLMRHFKRQKPCQVKFMHVNYEELLKNYDVLKEEYRIKFISPQNEDNETRRLIKENEELKEEIIKLKKKNSDLQNKLNKIKFNEPIKKGACLNDHGEENYKGVDFKTIIEKRFYAIPLLIEQLYYEIPQNRNVYIRDKNKYSYIRKDNKWILKQKKVVIEEMIYSAYNAIKTYVKDNSNELSNGQINAIEEALEKQMNNEYMKTSCYDNVCEIIYENQSIVQKYNLEIFGTRIKL